MQDEFIRDRKNIKWTAMMLSEHKGLLIDLEHAQSDVESPDKSEDELAEIAERLALAMKAGCTVNVQYWKDKRNHEVTGLVKKIDPYKQAVLIEAGTKEWDQHWITAGCIWGVESSG